MMMNFKKNQNNAVCSMDCKNCPNGASQPNPMDDSMFEKSIAMLHNWVMLEAIREDHPKERIVMVILPIAGMVLTFIACYELIQMLIEHNNLANFEIWTFFKWVFKTFLAVTLISNTFNITMAVFDVAQQVISRSGGLISGSTSVSDATLTAMQATLEGMDLGPLLGLYLQTFVVQVTMLALSAIIFVIVYGRMVEIYLMVSLAPIPFATFGNHEQSHTGQNYLRSLFALGFQGFLIMICVGIYAVLIQNLSFSDNIISSIWGVMGYTVLLAFTLFKTGSLAKSVFAAH